MADRGELVHATAVARWCPGIGRQAVLLSGSSGAGKSDLALRLIDRGWRLVGDDYVQLHREEGRLLVTGPDTIGGLIEARGLGLLSQPAVPACPVALDVRLIPGVPERLPERRTVQHLGLEVPALDLDPRPASAPLMVEAALRQALLHSRSPYP